jgi:hypothetical protein
VRVKPHLAVKVTQDLKISDTKLSESTMFLQENNTTTI